MIQKAECPQCGNEISVGSQPRIGQPVTCSNCNSELEVVWLDPLELDWPMLDLDEEEEDDDSDDEEEEY
jgi:alpha-aminoadipate carrier protein LysW